MDTLSQQIMNVSFSCQIWDSLITVIFVFIITGFLPQRNVISNQSNVLFARSFTFVNFPSQQVTSVQQID